MHEMIKAALHTMATIIFFLLMHWMATILYTTFCVQTSLVGLLYSFFTASSPMCRTILEMQYRTVGFYDAMFLFISTVLVQTFSRLVQTAATK